MTVILMTAAKTRGIRTRCVVDVGYDARVKLDREELCIPPEARKQATTELFVRSRVRMSDGS